MVIQNPMVVPRKTHPSLRSRPDIKAAGTGLKGVPELLGPTFASWGCQNHYTATGCGQTQKKNYEPSVKNTKPGKSLLKESI